MVSDTNPLRRVPYDPELQSVIDAYPPPPPDGLTLDMIVTSRALFDPAPGPDLRGGLIEAVDHTIVGVAGDPDKLVTVFRRWDRGLARPLLYVIHPGGMIVGNRFTGIDTVLAWVESLDVIVATVEYRLAPESPHPAPAEDSYAGLVWIADHGEDLGGDPEQLLVVGGSAGGGLAASVAIMARDRAKPAILAQLLMCPMLDDRNESVSSRQFDGIGIWDRQMNELGWTALLGSARGGPDVSPYAAPARLTDFSGLPPAFIDVGSAEVFRDEAVDYATRLWAAGVQAELHVWAGGYHGFAVPSNESRLSRQALAAQINWLERTLHL
jgi:acetyl esterase/lipase